MSSSFILSKVLPPVLGALGGYLYYKFIGCATGACPITSNPIISTFYGMLIGLAIAFSK